MRMPSCARESRSHDGKRNYAIVQFLLQTGWPLVVQFQVVRLIKHCSFSCGHSRMECWTPLLRAYPTLRPKTTLTHPR